MKILNFGSLNLDLVYQVPHFVRPGETLASFSRDTHVGGKGLNQSVALARAGATVFHAGCIGADGRLLKDYLADNGVNVRFIKEKPVPTGHAIIQVSPEGQNAILLFAGANASVTEAEIEEAIGFLQPGDWLLLQNEVAGTDKIIECAYKHNIVIVLNPSPVSPAMRDWPLHKVSWFLLNEIEGAFLAETDDPEKIREALIEKFPAAKFVLTLGEQGAVYFDRTQTVKVKAKHVQAVDTTGAGDTFTGYFLASVMRGESAQKALAWATTASAVAVTRPGAAEAIPTRKEVESW